MSGQKEGFAVGVDFGTNSVRAVVVSVESGRELGSCVYNYRGGSEGVILSDADPNLARQDPEEYYRGLEESVKGALSAAGGAVSPGSVCGIGADTTGSTPIPVDGSGKPLSFSREFKGNPNAMAWLWKDHTSFEEAEEITEKSRSGKVDYTEYSGGLYSSEWFFAKILRLARIDRKVYDSAASFVEHCDLMPAVLAGNTCPGSIKRSRCAAGHKAMFNEKWGGLPPAEFLTSVDPVFSGLRTKLYDKTYTAGEKAGELCGEWAEKLGLPPGIPVSCGAFDAHMGAVGAGISPGKLVKIMGTSSCDMFVSPPGSVRESIKGVCGQVEGSILPGMTGIEAGQSAVGDIFGWFRNFMMWPAANILPGAGFSPDDEFIQGAGRECWKVLSEKAEALEPGESGLLSLDWLNGNRNLLFDADLTGLIAGLTLGTKPEEVYLSLIEGTAFGAKMIMERLAEYGVRIDTVTASGGLAVKSPLIMSVYSSVLNVPIRVSSSEQTCALGAAIFGAAAGGCFESVQAAQERMSAAEGKTYLPVQAAAAVYGRLYELYKKLHDSFGVESGGENMRHVVKELLRVKRKVKNSRP